MPFINPNYEASYYHVYGESVVCDLCPHRCRVPPGGFGKCTARRNSRGKMVAYSYGRISSIAVDPIEKKPLYHYRPGSRIFSVGGIGCNLKCEYCQNYSISMSPIGKKRTTYKSAEEIVALCRQQTFDQIAFTYNEPAIWYEYIMDVMECDPGLGLVLVTNGMVNESPLKDLCRNANAMNIDIKAFTDDFYRKVCGGSLADAKRSCEVVMESGVHLELTYLMIPGHNDGDEEVSRFVQWVRSDLSPDVPVHFNRFHPDYEMMAVPMTPVETLLRAKSIAEENGLNYAYVGNVLADDATDTYCPECGAAVIKRTGYLIDASGLDGDRCAYCKHRLNIIRRPSEQQGEWIADYRHDDERSSKRDDERNHRRHQDVRPADGTQAGVDLGRLVVFGADSDDLPIHDVLHWPDEAALGVGEGDAKPAQAPLRPFGRLFPQEIGGTKSDGGDSRAE